MKISKSQANDLAMLIARMQRSADQVEKNVLRAEDLLAVDTENEKQGKPLLHQQQNADNLAEAEALLKDLFLDVDRSKKLQHPQATEIERDVSNLHDRWSKDCATYRDLYEQMNELDVHQRIDWAQVLDQKQKEIAASAYGPSLSDVEKQIANHNILHQKIEAYRSQLDPSNTSSAEQYSTIKKQYDTLLESSYLRQKHLASLYEYMQGCSKELLYSGEQQERILRRDWSDRMVDPRGLRMEYEKFKNSGMLSHERDTNHLQEEGDRLIKMKHPGSATIRAHRDALENEWQRFLNLCMCQQAHLDNIEDYKKYQLDTETLSESIKRVSSSLDPKSLENKSSPEILLTLEGDEPAIVRNEQRLAALKELSTSVAPLKLRYTRPTKPTSVVALCDWTDEEDSISRGEKLTLKSNAINEKWEVQNSRGSVKSLPGACFMVPPPNTEALDRVDSLARELSDLKRRRSALMASLRSPTVEVDRAQRAAPVASAPENPKALELANQLDKINKSLVQTERDILGRVRAPLDRRDPTKDLANRLKEHEKAMVTVRNLEAEKSAVQREMEPLLATKPLGPTTSTLPVKLSTANSKIDDINTLAEFYSKKVNSSMFLEKQIQKVDGIVSGLENQLIEDRAIPDTPNALHTRSQQLQAIRKDAASRQDEMMKLGRDLELTEQACNSLQKTFQEYCPDIQRQRTDVKLLRNRYATVNNQLQDRSTFVQEATNKNQGFQSAVQSMDFFLTNLPDNKIKPSDGVPQINSKQNSQKRVVEDLNRKSEEMERTKKLSWELQNVLNRYESTSEKYRGALKNDYEYDVKRQNVSTMADAVQQKERDLQNLYSEVSAENNQLLSQMGTAKNIMAMNEEKVSQVVVKQQLQLQSQQKSLVETDGLKKDLLEESTRRAQAEKNMDVYRQRFMSLKSRRGVERLEEKEVVQYYRDPRLESELEVLRNYIRDETVKRSGTRSELELVSEKVIRLETEVTRVEPKLVTKVLTEFEKDPQLDKEAAKMREEMRRIKQEVQLKETETVHMRNEVTVLSQKKQTIRETVVKKEVVKLEKDPEMLRAVLMFQNQILEEEASCMSYRDDIFRINGQISALERVIPTIEPKIVTKVLKRVEQDPMLIEEANKIRLCVEEESHENRNLTRELSELQMRFGEVDRLRPKLEVKEIINEVYRVDPETEVERGRLRNELQETSRRSADMEREISLVNVELQHLLSQKPKIEYKEVTQEVIKEEKSPEVTRELQRLTNQVSRLQVNYDSTLELLGRLRRERDELKAEKSKVETVVTTREVIKYENDPTLEKEADRLRREVRDETQKRRTIEETVFDLQNKYIMLERQKPEEKIVMQEVVRLQRDPTQIVEHERLNKSLDEELKARRKLELEVTQLRVLVEEKERSLAQLDDRQLKIQVEAELRQIRLRIHELETSPPPVEEKIVIEEVLKVERDPKLDRLTDNLRVDMETEITNISRLEREIRNLRIKLDVLQKEKSIERVVYKEVIRVEKDPAIESERDHLRDLVLQEKNISRDQEDQILKFTSKLTRLQTERSSTSQEETRLTITRDTILKEKDNYLKELRKLESERQEISFTFQQQSKLMSERNQTNRQRIIKIESDIQNLQKDIQNEREIHRQKDAFILELKNTQKKEDSSETQTRETNLSTKITILDPETGKDMSPYDAYLEGLIDRNQYIHLQELECDWEEITSTGPDGETTILQDRKSGKQFSVKDALRDGRLTQYDVQRYKEGKMKISEFALMVAGDARPRPYIAPPITTPRSPTKATSSLTLNSMPSSLRSSFPSLSSSYSNGSSTNLYSYNSGSTSNLSSYKSGGTTNLNSYNSKSTPNLYSAGDEFYPISGVLDTTTNNRMSVRSALTRKLIDENTALLLLEAQAATGGIVDLNKKDKLSVHKAAERGLIDTGHLHKLLNAQKAFTGVEDPVTKERLSAGQAEEKGWIPHESAMRYMEAQYLTGGLVNPAKAGRLTVKEALSSKMVDSTAAQTLQDVTAHTKDLVDPITGKKMSYKQAMDLCKKDVTTGLLLLPVASNDTTDSSAFSGYRFHSSHSQV